MTAFIAWFLVTLGIAAGVGLSLQLGESIWTDGVLSSARNRVLAFVASVAALVALALLYRIEDLARVDGRVVKALAEERGTEVTDLMSYLTTIGDVVPSFLIAAVLAVLIQAQGVHRYAWVLLPLAVLVELALQATIINVFDDVTMEDLFPEIMVGGAGAIPSGSVARLLCLFLIAARLWHSSDERASRQVLAVGGLLIVVQAVSRVYLARHLLADIACGLLLGLALALAAVALVRSSATSAGSRITTNDR